MNAETERPMQPQMDADGRRLNDTTESRVYLLPDFGTPQLEIGLVVTKF